LKNKTCTTPVAIWVSLLIGIGNTLEALAGYYLLHKLIHRVPTDQVFTFAVPCRFYNRFGLLQGWLPLFYPELAA
ncbi:MAG: hypothetical protein ACXVLT_07330, partial [Flavisolibacter sp.]